MLGVISFSVVVSLGPIAQNVSLTQTRLITVSGSSEVRIPPDEIVMTLGVETSSMDLMTARAENDQRINAMIKAAGSRGIRPEHLKTDYLNIEPRYQDGYAKRQFYGYFVQKTLVVTLRDIKIFESLLTELLQAGATHVHDVQFQTTELRRHRDEARAMAVRAAREKAEALARQLGQQIGDPQNISESGWYWYSPRSGWGNRWQGAATQNSMQTGAGGGVESALAPGLISVSAQVSVSFSLR
jgi:uncharacterized protein